MKFISRRKLILSLFILLLVPVLTMSMTQQAAADPGGRAWGHGYFTNAGRQSGGFGQVMVCGLVTNAYCNDSFPPVSGLRSGVLTKAGFISFIRGKLNGGGRDGTGAAFIIQLMRGGTDHTRPTAADITDWMARINNPQVTMRYANSVSFGGWNSGYMKGVADDAAFFPENGSASAIEFLVNGVVKFKLKANCANPIDDIPGGLPSGGSYNMDGWTTTTSHGGTVTGPVSSASANVYVNAYAGETVRYNYYLKNRGTIGSPAIGWNTGWNTGTGGAPTSGTAAAFAVGSTRTARSVESYKIPTTAALGSIYCRRLTYNPSASGAGAATSGWSCARVVAPALGAYTCGDLNPSDPTPEAGVAITVAPSVDFTAPVAPTAPIFTMNLGVTGLSGAPVYRPTSNLTFSATTATAFASPPVSFTPLVPGTYKFTWDFNGPGLASTPCSDTITVAKKPYFKVYSGDAAAGADFMTAGSCGAPPANSEIRAFNRGGAGFPGSGAQISAIAMDTIDGFTSGSFGTTSILPKGLTFANTGGGVGAFGGSFNGGLCIPDYWSLSDVSGAPAVFTGQKDIGATTLGTGAKTDVFVEGDAYISGSIVYTGSGSWNPSTVPYFRLIVRGNIYISGAVTELDGLYVALPNGASGGAIYTCAPDPSSGIALSEVYVSSNCDNKLTVYGAFIANTVKLLRTGHTIQDATTATDNRQPDGSAASNTNNAAEVFVYSPEVWIGVPQTSPPANMTYSGFTSLPPIL